MNNKKSRRQRKEQKNKFYVKLTNYKAILNKRFVCDPDAKWGKPL